ncbi:PadR family transcriptional regulator [Hoyosella rhizosphaerae]|uniref:Transcriptional regulator n=1 Tax=Hoyosella rhizosphaerae TaxID=1755582 RepID=A0A916XA95_9ACTN|nr:PadR family transcriptional regulator [Hoyosella rhizosphaerae]MBN4926466.1 PadR family transcriptional regulator [Hoyosella rhizosphaerae]GGC59131.1 transcriptional regulator [Hoyosella rhizosphaerae]
MRNQHPTRKSSTHRGPDRERRRQPRRPREDRPAGLHIEGFSRGNGLIRIGTPPHRRERNRRGDVRGAILLLLAEAPMHGYQLIQEIESRSDGQWKPSPGSIYPALSQLEDEGIVLIENIGGRKTAKLTEQGTSYVEENKSAIGDPFAVSDGKSNTGRELRQLARLVGSAATEVANVGTQEQRDKAAEILTDARKALYRLLADESPSS